MVWQWLPLLRVALLPRLLRWLTPGGGFVKAENSIGEVTVVLGAFWWLLGFYRWCVIQHRLWFSPLPIDSPPLSPLRRGIGSGRAGWPLRGALGVSARVRFA